MRRLRACVVILGAALLAGACKPESAQVGKDVGEASADTAVLKTASAAVNELLRVADDCEAARPELAKATAAVDEAARHLKTATGRATLDALRSQISKVQSACGS
jgi:hypothetical protein